MGESNIVQGSRFYLPRPYVGPDELIFTHVSGEPFYCRACEISCFELLAMKDTLRNFVVIHLGRSSYVLLETQADVVTMLESGHDGTQSPVQRLLRDPRGLSSQQMPL